MISVEKKMQNFCNTWKLIIFHSSAISWVCPNHPYPPPNTSHFSTLTLILNSSYFPFWLLSLSTLHKNYTHQESTLHICHPNPKLSFVVLKDCYQLKPSFNPSKFTQCSYRSEYIFDFLFGMGTKDL